jgi:hypothetical protein
MNGNGKHTNGRASVNGVNGHALIGNGFSPRSNGHTSEKHTSIDRQVRA